MPGLSCAQSEGCRFSCPEHGPLERKTQPWRLHGSSDPLWPPFTRLVNSLSRRDLDHRPVPYPKKTELPGGQECVDRLLDTGARHEIAKQSLHLRRLGGDYTVQVFRDECRQG